MSAVLSKLVMGISTQRLEGTWKRTGKAWGGSIWKNGGALPATMFGTEKIPNIFHVSRFIFQGSCRKKLAYVGGQKWRPFIWKL